MPTPIPRTPILSLDLALRRPKPTRAQLAAFLLPQQRQVFDRAK